MNNKSITLSDGEWKLMKLLWEKSPLTIAQMVEALEEDTGWSKTTVFVMLKRLIAKGAVTVDDSGRSQLYCPKIERSQVSEEATVSFIGKIWDGSVSMMVSALADHHRLSEEEIARLKQFIEEQEKLQKRR